MKLRSISINLAISVVSLAIFLGILEGVTRLVWTAEMTGSCREVDYVLVYKNKPNCEFRQKKPEGNVVLYQINACGHRGEGDCEVRLPDIYRVVGIGDSFTFGDMVPSADTYLKVAERSWKRNLAYQIEVFNGGVQGYDLHQYSLRMAEELGRDPQLVIVGLLPNDLFSDLSNEKIAEREGLVKQFGIQRTHELMYQESQRSVFNLLKTILSYSRFVDFITHILLSNEEVYLRIYMHRSNQEDSFLRTSYSPVWQKKIQNAERIIENMAVRARERHVRLAIIIIPQRIQALLVKNIPEDRTIDPFAFSNRIQSIGKRHGVPVFDFLERLSRHSDPVGLYYPVDGHLTPEGQQLLGQFVAERLVYADVIPQIYP